MAGTIISTPSLGASNWSPWITQQGLTDRGYMRVSLTNMSGTAASTIAAGGALECAGSIYSFTDTAISLATGTASASVAVYFYAIPSAGGTTCTVEMNSIAPTWRDDYQGFYASAASTTRVIGGCYIGTAGSYYSKFLYDAYIANQCISQGTTRPLLRYVRELGEWNMDATEYLEIPIPPIMHETRIRNFDAIIRSDADTTRLPIHGVVGAGTAYALGYIAGFPGNAYLRVHRVTGGQFDGGAYDGTASTIANRGWLYIEYEA